MGPERSSFAGGGVQMDRGPLPDAECLAAR